jgi:DnaJ family protein C protein 8
MSTSTTPQHDPQDLPRIAEIQRVLMCSKIDFIAILNLPLEFTDEDVKRQYKTLSLLLHPDKAPKGFEDRAKFAFTALNAGKEAMNTPEQLKEWQKVVLQAEKDIQDAKIPELTEQRKQGAKKMGLENWATFSITLEELKKIPEYEIWVRKKIKDNLAAEDFKKQLLMKKREQQVREHQEAEEQKSIKRQQIMGVNSAKGNEEVDKPIIEERAANWQQFQAKRVCFFVVFFCFWQFVLSKFLLHFFFISKSHLYTNQFPFIHHILRKLPNQHVANLQPRH